MELNYLSGMVFTLQPDNMKNTLRFFHLNLFVLLLSIIFCAIYWCIANSEFDLAKLNTVNIFLENTDVLILTLYTGDVREVLLLSVFVRYPLHSV